MSLRYAIYKNPFRKKEYMATTRPRQIYSLEDLAKRMELFYGRQYSYSQLLGFFTCLANEVEDILQEVIAYSRSPPDRTPTLARSN